MSGQTTNSTRLARDVLEVEHQTRRHVTVECLRDDLMRKEYQ